MDNSPKQTENSIDEGQDGAEDEPEEDIEPEIPLNQLFSFEEAIQLIQSGKSCEVLGQPQNLRLLVNMVDEEGCTLLHHAARAGKLDCCELMIEKGANVGIRNRKGENAAHVAMANDRTECSIALLKAIGESRKSSPWLF
jgi:hypothetical protein